MSQSTKTALAVLCTVLLAGAFWLLLIAPKKNKADELSEQVTSMRSQVASAQHQATVGLAAKHNFSHSYQQLVLLGKAVPADAGTASMMVQLNEIGDHNHTPFLGIKLEEGGGSEEPEIAGEEAEDVSALPPLGSSEGAAGLRAMPYQLSFQGGFFDAADFISDVDRLVQTKQGRLYANGRLMTFDSFEISLTKNSLSYKSLDIKFHTTAYATPPGQGLTAGASSAGPAFE